MFKQLQIHEMLVNSVEAITFIYK